MDYIQFDTNRVGGITQARKIAALAEAHSIPVIPHAGTDAQLSRRDGEPQFADGRVLPAGGRRSGQRAVLVLFDGEPKPKDGFIDLDENVPGLGLTVEMKRRFEDSRDQGAK